MGFKEGQAEQILIASFRQFPLRRIGDKKGASADGKATAPTPKPAASPDKPKASADEKKSSETSGEKSGDSQAKSSDAEGVKSENKKSVTLDETTKETAPKKPKSKSQSAIRYTDEGRQVPVGNGGSTTRYVWTQTLDEAVVHIPVPEGTRAKDLDVEITPSSLSIKRKEEPSDDNIKFDEISGTLFGRVKPSESTWTMESNSSSDTNTTTILITLDKVQKTWWSTILSGDPEIDNRMVDSTRHIGTYDEKTQAQIRRIMFDQRQERLGLPSSEELSGEGVGKLGVPMPKGVEVIDQETLEKAGASKSCS
jgi:HSP20 family molecular chaperone IbpA